jgi:glycolate oxidase
MTSLQMPKVDKSILSNKDKIALDLSKILKSENILSHEDEVRPYETDALAAYKQKPLLVVLPETVEQVSEILKYCNVNKIKVVPRGAGTGLSGGALPLADCVLLGMGKFNKILEIDYQNKCVVLQPCVTNLAITNAVQDKNFYQVK